ncbi:MAG: ribosomal L7Ae/L30e/S12e/Gadd45 family protein [Ruminococcus sp.]|jgi:ribosomal protein L7Ae-like RNA K-turn-binding protein|nr:ribosomal L7Ae/L30e/S12e/Gadd45 family protein [Ruminococcus sp.]
MLDADNKVFGALTMARKAGKLILGFDAVCDSLKAETAKLVIITADVSKKTEKEVRFFCGRYNTDIISVPFMMEDIYNAVGKKCGALSVVDSGLAGLITAKLNECRTPMEDNN